MQASATLLHNLKAHTDEVAQLSFSPDGETLAAHDDSILILWDVKTESLLSKFEDAEDMLFGMAFSPDSQWIAAASGGGSARIWNARTGELKHMVDVDDERMLSLMFSPDGKVLATGSEVLRVWDVETGVLKHTLLAPGDHSLSFAAMYERQEYPGEISEVVFARGGQILVSVCPNTSTVCIWNTESWELQYTIRGHFACFSSDEQHLAVSSDTFTTTKIYDTSTWQLQSTLETHDQNQEIYPSIFSPDDKFVATYSGREIVLWNISSGKSIKTIIDLTRKLFAPAFSSDGKILISGARKCGLRVWDVESGDNILMLEPEDGARDPWNSNWIRGGPPAFQVLFGDGGAKVAIAFPDGSVRIWNVRWDRST